MGAEAWYVLHSKPHRENHLHGYLISHGFDTFYPTVKVRRANSSVFHKRPYFPGYLFVRANLNVIGTSSLQWLPGAIGLIQFGGQPASVPDSVIHELKRRVNQIEAAGGFQLSGLKPGDRVCIVSGPLAGYEAIFDSRLSGTGRVQVLLEMLGRPAKVQVNAACVEKKRMKLG